MTIKRTFDIAEQISDITELNDMSEFMQDPQLDRALALIIKILYERDRNPAQGMAAVITELQALATIFADDCEPVFCELFH